MLHQPKVKFILDQVAHCSPQGSEVTKCQREMLKSQPTSAAKEPVAPTMTESSPKKQEGKAASSQVSVKLTGTETVPVKQEVLQSPESTIYAPVTGSNPNQHDEGEVKGNNLQQVEQENQQKKKKNKNKKNKSKK